MTEEIIKKILAENLEAHRQIYTDSSSKVKRTADQIKWVLGLFIVFFISFMVNINGRVSTLEERTCSTVEYVKLKDFKRFERDKLYVYAHSFTCLKPKELQLQMEQKIRDL